MLREQLNRPTILCVDDEPSALTLRVLVVQSHGYVAIPASSGRSALVLFEERHPNLVVLDYQMPEMNGMETAIRLRKIDPNVPLILLSAYIDLSPAVTSHFDAYLPKGVQIESFLECINRLLKRETA